MANTKRTLKLRTYTIVAEEVERGIEVGIHRAYKHSDEPLSDAQREHIIENVARAIMDQLSDVVDWGNGDDD
jgi:hypothetical protein